ncbi:MAG: class I SAM-dependent rRNA methyltransferase [Acidobacteriales bacterium]|nr:class I SAM-dependent rRNA methyltransferase [Terriglobales bacterium]
MPVRAEIPALAVTPRAAKRLRAGHPWVYRTDLSPKTKGITPQAMLVHVIDERGMFLASALSSSSSQIALRVIAEKELRSAEEVTPLVRQRVLEAAAYRKRFVSGSDAYRVIFSEADRLPGLIVDRYRDVFTLQFLTQAMDSAPLRAAVIEALHEAFGASLNLVERVDARIRELESLPQAKSRLLEGKKSETEFDLNGLIFRIDALGGQKTGAFLDQRENYAAAARHAHGSALDVFCYQGGFALHLGRVCSRVVGVDASREALEAAEQNAVRNAKQMQCDEIEWLEGSAFDVLKDYAHAGKQYDTIVLDPPAFAKTKRALPTALKGYKEINLRALKMLRPGGILVTCSCSQHVSPADFAEMLASAAADARRTVRILETRSQSLDHPVVATIPETAYLKCLICHVS